jgi:hypothetical protein
MSSPTRSTTDETVAALDKIVGKRDCAPVFIRCDNGPELIATHGTQRHA